MIIVPSDEMVLFGTEAKITRDSIPCYFCLGVITRFPYYEFTIEYDGREGQRNAHITCFEDAKRHHKNLIKLNEKMDVINSKAEGDNNETR